MRDYTHNINIDTNTKFIVTNQIFSKNSFEEYALKLNI